MELEQDRINYLLKLPFYENLLETLARSRYWAENKA
jgi:hypothetical protein